MWDAINLGFCYSPVGMEISDIQNCLAWLFPFYKVLKDGLPVQLKRFPEREVSV